MPWQAARRATLLIPSGPAHDPERLHLHIVLNDPHPDTAQALKVLLVSVTGIPASQMYDPSCSLFAREHPFINKPSYVLYRAARLVDPQLLDTKVLTKAYVAKPLVDEALFAYIVTGLRESLQTAPYLLAYFEAAVKATRPSGIA
jgi:hypothetical protein